jgi:PhnB protein
MPVTPRAGYRSVTPRVFVDDVGALVQFLRDVLDATGEVEIGRPTVLRIGDSVVMVSSTDDRAAFPAFLYVYVENADETFRRAVDAGAEALEAPIDTPYGDRRAMVRDPFGNILQIANSSAVAENDQA